MLETERDAYTVLGEDLDKGILAMKSRQELLGFIGRKAIALTGARTSSILISHKKEDELSFEGASGEFKEVARMRMPASKGFAGKVVAEAQSIICNNVAADPTHYKVIDNLTGYKTENILAVPMIVRGNVFGVLEALNKPEGFTEEDRIRLEKFAAKFAGPALHVQDSEIRSDELTGFFKKEFFMEELKRAMDEAFRYERGVVLCFYDIDHFKGINDDFGHPQGDAILKDMAEANKRMIRGYDLTGRYGGEEMIMCLMQIGKEKGAEKAEQFRRAVEKKRYGFRNIHTSEVCDFNVTISIGIAVLSDVGEAALLYKFWVEGVPELVGASVRREDVTEMVEKHSKKTGIRTERISGYLTAIQEIGEQFCRDNHKDPLRDLINDREFRMNLGSHIFVKRADDTMYTAKRNGRNRVEIYQPGF